MPIINNTERAPLLPTRAGPAQQQTPVQQSTGLTSDDWFKLGIFTLFFLTPTTLLMAYDLGRPKEDRYVPINDTAYKISFSAYLSAPLLYVLKQMMNEFCCKKNPETPGVIAIHSKYDSTAVNTKRVPVQPAAARAEALARASSQSQQ